MIDIIFVFYVNCITMPIQTDKDRTIRQVYYDVDTGFGSISETFKESHKY